MPEVYNVKDPLGLEATRSLFRPARGPELHAMFEGVSAYEELDRRFTLSTDPEGNVSPRVILAKSKELETNSEQLAQIDLAGRTLLELLAEKTPSIAEPRTVSVDHTSHHINYRGEHFLALRLDQESEYTMRAERFALWHLLAELAGVEKLSWKQFPPELKVAHMSRKPRKVGEWYMQPVVEKMGAFLPMSVTLDPLTS